MRGRLLRRLLRGRFVAGLKGRAVSPRNLAGNLRLRPRGTLGRNRSGWTNSPGFNGAIFEGVSDNVGRDLSALGALEGLDHILYCLGDQGLNVIAQNSYHAEVIDLMTNNLAVVDAPSSKGIGNEVDMEQLLLRNPDIIIFAPDSYYDQVADDPVWQDLTAIQNGDYYEVPFGPYNWMGFPPSVNRYLGMLWMGALLYPDQIDYDLYTEVARYYDIFYHCDLTQEQFDALTANSIGKLAG